MSPVKQLLIGGYGPFITTLDDSPGVIAVKAARHASFLAAHPTLPVVYAVTESDAGQVAAYRVEDGRLGEPQVRSSEGDSPCHLAVHPAGGLLAVANYGDGTVSLHRLDAEGAFTGGPIVLRHRGSGPVAERQQGSHAHQVVFDGDLLYVTDLGTDEIRCYDLDGVSVGDVVLAPGSGPRHLVVSGDIWYITGELDGTVTRIDRTTGQATSVPASAIEGLNYPSHLELVGDLLFVGNRGPNTIAVFRAADLSMVAEVPSGGEWPRHFAVEGDRLYVANQNSGTLAVLPLKEGLPAPAVQTLAVQTPTCVLTLR